MRRHWRRVSRPLPWAAFASIGEGGLFLSPLFSSLPAIDKRALTRGGTAIYNVAESDGTVLSRKAETELGWRADFRIVEPV